MKVKVNGLSMKLLTLFFVFFIFNAFNAYAATSSNGMRRSEGDIRFQPYSRLPRTEKWWIWRGER